MTTTVIKDTIIDKNFCFVHGSNTFTSTKFVNCSFDNKGLEGGKLTMESCSFVECEFKDLDMCKTITFSRFTDFSNCSFNGVCWIDTREEGWWDKVHNSEPEVSFYYSNCFFNECIWNAIEVAHTNFFNNEFDDCVFSPMDVEFKNTTFSGNSFSGATVGKIYCEKTTIFGNYFAESTIGAVMLIGRGNKIIGNVFDDCCELSHQLRNITHFSEDKIVNNRIFLTED